MISINKTFLSTFANGNLTAYLNKQIQIIEETKKIFTFAEKLNKRPLNFMINRILIRIKIIQILYSFYKSDGKSLPSAEKELFHSIEKTYDLYYHLLQLAVEITHYANLRTDARKNKLRPTPEDLNPNMRFVENRYIEQLASNKQLNKYISEHGLSWSNYPEIVKKLYDDIVASDFYAEYMESPLSDYEADKNIWKKIYKKIILQSEELDNSIEEQNIYWTNDIELVVSFIIKTIKRFNAATGSNQELLPMFKDEEDVEFARKLLQNAINHCEEYRELIDKNTKNWELDRIAFMDIVIMQAALAELMEFPAIPVNVTLNEFIEIAKIYSTEKSGTFINGVLDNIVGQLKKENKLIKVIMLNENRK